MTYPMGGAPATFVSIFDFIFSKTSGAAGKKLGRVPCRSSSSVGSLEIIVDANSVDTRDEKRDQHLMSPDFFDAKQYPDVTFKSKKVTAKGDDFAVDGELSIRGVTKPLSVVVKKTGEGEFYGARIGYETTFTIKRSDFGMEYGIAKNVLGDEVTLIIAIEGVHADK